MPPVAILAGGLAMRLRPETDRLPKSLLEVAGQPFIFHQLQTLRDNHIERAVLCVGYQGEMIRDAAGDGSRFGMQVDYSFDAPAQLGTGGALKNALPLLPEEFFVLYGDSYLACTYAEVYQAFRQKNKPALMTVYRNSGQGDSSNVVYRDGLVAAYDKKNPSGDMNYIDYGLSVVTKKIFGSFDLGDAFDLEELFSAVVAQKEMAGYEVTERFYEIGSKSGLAELREYLAHR